MDRLYRGRDQQCWCIPRPHRHLSQTRQLWNDGGRNCDCPSLHPATDTDRKLQADWDNYNSKAKGTMLKSISESNRRLIAGQDAPTSWQTLKAHHASVNDQRKFELLQDFASVFQEDKEDLTEFLAKVQLSGDRIVNVLTTVNAAGTPTPPTGQEVIDLLVAYWGVQNLKDTKANREFVLSLSVNGLFSRSAIVTGYAAEQSRRSKEEKNKERALAAQTTNHPPPPAYPSKSKKGKKRSTKAGNLHCTHCGSDNHMVDKCFEKFPDTAPDWFTKLTKKDSTLSSSSVKLPAALLALTNKLEERALQASLRVNTDEPSTNTEWNTDTGATSHMTPHRHWIRNMIPCHVKIRVANDQVVYAEGRGEVLFQPSVNGDRAQPILFSRVLYVPRLSDNLLAVLPLVRDHNIRVNVEPEGMVFKQRGDVILTASYDGNAAFLDGTTIPESETALAAIATPPVTRSLLHRRLGHIGESRLDTLLKDKLVDGIAITSKGDKAHSHICEPCIAGKQHREPFKHSTSTTSHPLEAVVSDLHGPLPITDEGYKYWILFVDVHTRITHVYPVKRKSDTFDCFVHFKALVERQTGHKIKKFRDDKGGEYIGTKWNEHMDEAGIYHEHTVTDTPEQNGIAERKNRTLEEMITSMLNQAKMPRSCWFYALKLAVRINNATPTSAVRGKTPYEAFFGRKPDLSMLRTFGCRAYVHVRKGLREAGWKTERCIYIGFEEGYKGFKCYNAETNKFVVSRDVIFDEDDFPGIPWIDGDEEYTPISGGYYEPPKVAPPKKTVTRGPTRGGGGAGPAPPPPPPHGQGPHPPRPPPPPHQPLPPDPPSPTAVGTALPPSRPPTPQVIDETMAESIRNVLPHVQWGSKDLEFLAHIVDNPDLFVVPEDIIDEVNRRWPIKTQSPQASPSTSKDKSPHIVQIPIIPADDGPPPPAPSNRRLQDEDDYEPEQTPMDDSRAGSPSTPGIRQVKSRGTGHGYKGKEKAVTPPQTPTPQPKFTYAEVTKKADKRRRQAQHVQDKTSIWPPQDEDQESSPDPLILHPGSPSSPTPRRRPRQESSGSPDELNITGPTQDIYPPSGINVRIPGYNEGYIHPFLDSESTTGSPTGTIATVLSDKPDDYYSSMSSSEKRSTWKAWTSNVQGHWMKDVDPKYHELPREILARPEQWTTTGENSYNIGELSMKIVKDVVQELEDDENDSPSSDWGTEKGSNSEGEETEKDNSPSEESSPTDSEPEEEPPVDEVAVMAQALETVYGSNIKDYHYVDYDQGLHWAYESCLKVAADDTSPRTFTEAMARPDSDKWLDATKAEMKALIHNGTWQMVKLPPDRKAIGSKWVFKIKRDADGNIDKYKARLVAQGFSQRPGLDFLEDQTFAPTMRIAAVRTIFAIAAKENAEIHGLDVSNAYLNGVLPNDQVVFMKQAPGFEEDTPEHVYRLIKGLYGLKQAGRLWYQRLAEVLEHAGFKRLVSDPAIYLWTGRGVKIVIPVFVDDITIIAQSKERVQWVKNLLAKHFNVKDLGEISWLLSMKVERDRKRRTLYLSQRQYIIDLLDRFDMSQSKPVETPMNPGYKLSNDDCPKTDEEAREVAGVPYATAVGALQYLAIMTRPDISYTVSKLARFTLNPGPRHWQAVKHLLRYLKGTMDLRLTYGPDSTQKSTFTTYTDADFSGDKDSGRSTNGFLIKIGSGAVSWASKLQGPVAKSSTEAEFYGAAFAGTEIKWMQSLLGELGYHVDIPSPLHIDNQSTIQVLNDTVHHSRMKHIPVQEFWIRNEISSEKTIQTFYMPTEHLPADMMTKPLPRILVQRHRPNMGLL